MGVCAVGAWLVRCMWLGMLANKMWYPSPYPVCRMRMAYGVWTSLCLWRSDRVHQPPTEAEQVSATPVAPHGPGPRPHITQQACCMLLAPHMPHGGDSRQQSTDLDLKAQTVNNR